MVAVVVLDDLESWLKKYLCLKGREDVDGYDLGNDGSRCAYHCQGNC